MPLLTLTATISSTWSILGVLLTPVANRPESTEGTKRGELESAPKISLCLYSIASLITQDCAYG